MKGGWQCLPPLEWSGIPCQIFMKFKVGQKVRVKKDLVIGRQYGEYCFNIHMVNLRGKILVVSSVFDNGYHVEEPSYFIFSDEMLEPAEFTKADLETGMVVEYRDGRLRVVFGNRLLGKQEYCLLNEFEETLLEKGTNRNMDIMKVYRPRVEQLYDIEDFFEFARLELIWERQEDPEAEEMTLAEIEKELGRKIKIISEE